MKTLRNLCIILSIFFLGPYAITAQNADTLLRKMDNLMSAPADKEATVKITLTDKSGKVKEREAHMIQKGKDKKLYRYTKPEKQAGIATLSLPEDVMWMYMPAFGKPTKISLLSKSQAFTGTDFSYEDMESRSYSERYSPTLLKSEDASTYLLELIPISKKSKYSKIHLHLNKDNFYPFKMEYFDNKENVFKEATYKYKKQGKYWYAEEVLMTDLKKEHSTQIKMTDLKFDQGLTDEVFSLENLKSGDKSKE
jgi:outer membrane lipoprotein-sorting protein